MKPTNYSKLWVLLLLLVLLYWPDKHSPLKDVEQRSSNLLTPPIFLKEIGVAVLKGSGD